VSASFFHLLSQVSSAYQQLILQCGQLGSVLLNLLLTPNLSEGCFEALPLALGILCLQFLQSIQHFIGKPLAFNRQQFQFDHCWRCISLSGDIKGLTHSLQITGNSMKGGILIRRTGRGMINCPTFGDELARKTYELDDVASEPKCTKRIQYHTLAKLSKCMVSIPSTIARPRGTQGRVPYQNLFPFTSPR